MTDEIPRNRPGADGPAPGGDAARRWRPADFSQLERRLTEAKTLLEQAAQMMAASEMNKVSALADLQMDEARSRDDHTFGRRYR